MSNCIYSAGDYGATGVAEPAETLTLENLQFKWIHYPAGTTALIYRSRANAEYDSAGIQRAIDAAHAAGGGTVVVPAGDYLIGPIELKSHVCLHLEPGARLWGSPVLADYADGSGSRHGLFFARAQRNFGITGHGQISGQSPAFIIPWMNDNPQRIEELERSGRSFLFRECEHVFLEGIRIQDTPRWSVVFDNCREVRVDGIRLRSMDVINNDGIDLVNSSNVIISNCDLYCTDDAIVLKNLDEGTTMRNVTVTNCVIRTWCNGFKIGTESVGNFEDITVSNLVMHGDDGRVGDRGGINLCAVDGGTVRNVNVSNIVMRNMFCPLYLYVSDRDRIRRRLGLEPRKAGLMERIHISNIVADGARYTSWAVGHPDAPIRDLVISNVDVRKTCDFQDRIPGPVPHRPDEYPTPFTFGSRDGGDELPACGLYLRHVESAVIRDFRVENTESDARELLVQEACTDVEASGLRYRNATR